MPSLNYEQIARKTDERTGRLDAEFVFAHLQREVDIFQLQLQADEELGLLLGNYGVNSEIHIREIGYRNPCMIEFVGLLAGSRRVKLVQHISQLNFLLVAVPSVEEQAYRIGFGADI